MNKKITTLHFTKLFYDSLDPVIIESPEGIVLEMNRAAEVSYGFSRKKLIGKPIKTIVPKERHRQATELKVLKFL